MSWLSKLFSGGGEDAVGAGAKGGATEEYKGFTIRATLMPAGSEFQLAGMLEKDIGGELKQHQFVRADRFSSKSEAETAALGKGRQIIDEQGDKVFAQSWPAKAN
jgi:hypothetical protein